MPLTTPPRRNYLARAYQAADRLAHAAASLEITLDAISRRQDPSLDAAARVYIQEQLTEADEALKALNDQLTPRMAAAGEFIRVPVEPEP